MLKNLGTQMGNPLFFYTVDQEEELNQFIDNTLTPIYGELLFLINVDVGKAFHMRNSKKILRGTY